MKWDRYLLGSLSAGEQDELEERLFRDDRLFEEIQAAEDDLILRYLNGGLSRRYRKRFELEYLHDQAHRDRLEFMRNLIALHSVTEKRAKRSPWLPLDSSVVGWGWAILATAAIVLIAWIAQTSLRHRPPLGNIEQNTASVSPKAAMAPPQNANGMQPESHTPNVAPALSFVLSPTATRGGSGAVFNIPTGASSIQLHLLTLNETPYTTYRITLRTADGARMWNGSSKSLTSVKVPAAPLADGDYVLSLEGKTSRGAFETVEDYVFRVVRR